jgi:membrane-associated phospholipid phosphatase
VSVLSAIIAHSFTSWLLKPIFARTEPMLWVWQKTDVFHFLSADPAQSSSFPSGHMAFMTAVMVGLSSTLPEFRAISVCVCLFTALILVAVDVHFLSDTLAGAVVGASTALAVAWMWERTFPFAPAHLHQ